MGFRSYGVVPVMRKSIAMLGCGLAISLSAKAAGAEISRARAAIAALPKRAGAAAAFVPPGWSVEVQVESDLDADQKPDTVLVALEDGPEYDRERAILVLLRRDDGYVLGGSNVGLVACWMCSGVKGGDGTPLLDVKKGVLLVDQISGSREFTTRLNRFRWSPARRVFELIGEDIRSADAVTGASTDTSCNFLTRECVETETPPQVDEEGRDIQVQGTTRSWRLPKKPLRALERVED